MSDMYRLKDKESTQLSKYHKIIYRDTLTCETELDKYIRELCANYPQCYVTYGVIFGHFWFHIYQRKPQSLTPDTEDTYRHHGGWFRDGEIVKPSKSWVKRFNFVPVMR